MENLRVRYVTPQGAIALRKYRYMASDPSPMYNYFLSPVAEFLVQFVPESVAPNTITLAGHFCICAMYLMFIFYCFDCEVPRWMTFFSCFLYFSWLFLDNMDGKQARRTKMSTPLGLIFDHQVDALSTFQSCTMIAMLQMYGGHDVACYIWVMAASPFYFATWEEYHVGILDLPTINGVSDGCVLIGLIIFGTGVTGAQAWMQPIIMGWQLRELAFAFFILSAIVTVGMNVKNVYYRGKPGPMTDSLLGYFYVMGAFLIVKYTSPISIANSHYVGTMAFFGFIFAKECGLLQLGHVTNQPYRTSRAGKILLLTMTLHTIGVSYGYQLMDEVAALNVGVLCAAISYYYSIGLGWIEMAEVLEIDIFGTKRKPRTS